MRTDGSIRLARQKAKIPLASPGASHNSGLGAGHAPHCEPALLRTRLDVHCLSTNGFAYILARKLDDCCRYPFLVPRKDDGAIRRRATMTLGGSRIPN